MPNDAKIPENIMPVPGPGVTDWLSAIIGTPRASKSSGPLSLPAGFLPLPETATRLGVALPDEVVHAEGGTLQRIEIRGLPKGVELSAGNLSPEGYWDLAPEYVKGLSAVVPGEVDLPFSVMLKGVFAGDDPDATWSELTGYEFTGGHDRPAPAAPEPEPETTPETKTEPVPAAKSDSAGESTPQKPVSMVVIDLDVSVGTDDPDVLKGISVRFSGLPDGASLSAGTDDNGTWTVSALDLADLSIVIPGDTGDFDLDVEMDIAGSEPQSASIHVENTPVDVNPSAAFKVVIAPQSRAGKARISIYSDGTVTYDQVVDWRGVDEPVELLIPYIDDALPFEIVMRYDTLGEADCAPKLMEIAIDGVVIPPNAPEISAAGAIEDGGLAWQGDLVVDVRHALKAQPLPSDDFTEDAHVPSEMAEPEANAAPPSPVLDDASEADAVLDPAAMPAEQTPIVAEEPAEDFADPVGGIDDDAPVDETDRGILVVDATYDDLQRPAFLNELRNLRDFIRTRADDANGEIYDRLGIDVTKWHDMAAHGPSGAEVDLDPKLPLLAPRGGIDNTRDFLPLNLSDVADGTDIVVRVSGLAPGALLTHGRNMGNGVWQLHASEAEGVCVLPPIADVKSAPLHIASGDSGDAENIKTKKSLVVGLRRRPPYPGGTDMHDLPLTLDAALFDPDGHGALSLTIGDMAPGTILSRGRNHGGGVWTLDARCGDTVSFLTARGAKPFAATLTCVALNPETGDSTVVSRIVDITPSRGKIRLRSEMAA